MSLGFGIIGAGQRCMYFFGPEIQKNDKSHLVAISEKENDRLQSAITDLGGNIRGYSNIDDLLRDKEVEAIIISTPDYTHRELLDKALDAGKHVICEKPMATTFEDALHITLRSRATSKVVQIGFLLRFAPMFTKLKEIVDSGAVGKLVQVNASEVVEYYHGASFFRRWQRYRKQSGGLLVHKACHTFDLINWLVGSIPKSVSAIGGRDTFIENPEGAQRCRECNLIDTCPAAYRSEEYSYTYMTIKERSDVVFFGNDTCPYNVNKDIIDNAMVMTTYENGVRFTFNFSTTGRRHERRFMLVGDQGVVTASQADGKIVVEPLKGEIVDYIIPEESRDEHGGGDEYILGSFLNSVYDGEPSPVDVKAGMTSLAIALGATESIDVGGNLIDLAPYLQGLD